MQRYHDWLELSECLGPRSMLFRPLIEAFGSPDRILGARESEIRHVLPDVSDALLDRLLRRHKRERAAKIAAYCERAGVQILAYGDDTYPAALRELPDPPVLLYCRGTLPDFEQYATVGVVGPRLADAYGEAVAYKLSFELSAAGVVIVNGMADGVDGVALAGAIAAGGSVVAVLGCGIDVTYPKHHDKLLAECVECGAVITEYAPGTPPNGYNFPVRNRLISALSRVVLVVQGNERSGALITARYAISQGTPLFAVPGNITSPLSAGSNMLLQMGAQPALASMDVLYPLLPQFHRTLTPSLIKEAEQYAYPVPEMFKRFGLRSAAEKEKREKRRRERAQKSLVQTERSLARASGRGEASNGSPASREAPDLGMLTPEQRKIYDVLPEGAFSVDDVTARGVPVSKAIGTLTIFEVYGLLGALPGGLYEKK